MFLHINECVKTRLHPNLNQHFKEGAPKKNTSTSPKSWFNKNTNGAVHVIALKKPTRFTYFRSTSRSCPFFRGELLASRSVQCNPQKVQLVRFPPIFSLNNDHGRNGNPFPNLPSWELTDPPSKKGSTFESMIFLFPRWAIRQKTSNLFLVGGFKYFFYVHPETWGKIIQFDEHIFQMGWFNHQPTSFVGHLHFNLYLHCYVYGDHINVHGDLDVDGFAECLGWCRCCGDKQAGLVGL